MIIENKLPFQTILMEGIQNLVFVIRVGEDAELYYEFLNRSAMEATGLTEESIGMGMKDIFDESKYLYFYERYDKAITMKKPYTYNDSYQSLAGKTLYSQNTLTPILDEEDNHCTHVVAVVKDITEERLAKLENKKATSKLEDSEKRLRIIAEHAHDLITLLDHDGRFIYASPSYKDTLDFHNENYIGKLFIETIHQNDKQTMKKELHKAVAENKSCKMQFQQRHRSKGWIWLELTGTPVFDDDHQFSHIVLVSRDISLQKQYERNLEYYALHDILSGLPNRLQFNQRLKEAIKTYQVSNDGLAVLMVDIDNFKKINDTRGHDIGDLVITEFGRRLNSCLRNNDLAARLGGDEFAILLPGIKCKDDAIKVALRIKEVVQNPWMIKNKPIKVTTSIGISLAAHSDLNEFSILKTADIALYEAKNSGKDKFKIRECTV